MIECLITGCDLYLVGSAMLLHGDLHATEDTYIFNGVLYRGEAAWEYSQPEPRKSLVVRLLEDNFFERRGVVVFEQKDASLNDAARKYVGEAL